MAFIISGGAVVTYAEALDVKDKDQRLFEGNEIDFTNVPDSPGSLNNYIEDLTIKATARINEKIRQSARWREYLGFAGAGYDSINNLPQFKGINIKSRQSDFTDMCCYYTLKEYLLPKVADERWGLEPNKTYLYDSLVLYRQSSYNDWNETLKKIKTDIQNLV